jgi:hypothetical protein
LDLSIYHGEVIQTRNSDWERVSGQISFIHYDAYEKRCEKQAHFEGFLIFFTTMKKNKSDSKLGIGIL